MYGVMIAVIAVMIAQHSYGHHARRTLTFFEPHSSFFFCSTAKPEPPAGTPIIARTANSMYDSLAREHSR
jgi:hypothetical protein